MLVWYIIEYVGGGWQPKNVAIVYNTEVLLSPQVTREAGQVASQPASFQASQPANLLRYEATGQCLPSINFIIPRRQE